MNKARNIIIILLFIVIDSYSQGHIRCLGIEMNNDKIYISELKNKLETEGFDSEFYTDTFRGLILKIFDSTFITLYQDELCLTHETLRLPYRNIFIGDYEISDIEIYSKYNSIEEIRLIVGERNRIQVRRCKEKYEKLKNNNENSVDSIYLNSDEYKDYIHLNEEKDYKLEQLSQLKIIFSYKYGIPENIYTNCYSWSVDEGLIILELIEEEEEDKDNEYYCVITYIDYYNKYIRYTNNL